MIFWKITNGIRKSYHPFVLFLFFFFFHFLCNIQVETSVFPVWTARRRYIAVFNESRDSSVLDLCSSHNEKFKMCLTFLNTYTNLIHTHFLTQYNTKPSIQQVGISYIIGKKKYMEKLYLPWKIHTITKNSLLVFMKMLLIALHKFQQLVSANLVFTHCCDAA